MLNFEIEGVYDEYIREEQTQAADDQVITGEDRLITVTPTVKLDIVSTGTLFKEGSKSQKIFEILKANIPESEIEFISREGCIARPIVTDANGHYVAGIADCLRADKNDRYVSSFPVEEEFEDDRQAFFLIAEARGIAKLSPAAIKQSMLVMYEDISPRTAGKRSGDGESGGISNLALHWSKFTHCSIDVGEREVSATRKSEGLGQEKTYSSASRGYSSCRRCCRQIQEAIRSELDQFSTWELYLQDRLRRRISSALPSCVRP